MKKLLVGIYLFLAVCLQAQEEFSFVPNGGQWHPNALFKTDVPSGALFLEDDGLKYSFYDASFFHNLHEGNAPEDKIAFHAFEIKFKNCLQPNIQLHGIQEGELNYFLGNDPSKWAKGLKSGGEVYYKNIYDKIDFKIFSVHGKLKYEFVVHPGGKVSDVLLEFTGLDELFLDDGRLHMVSSLGTMMDDQPISYQRGNNAIATRFIVEGNQVRFWVDDYDERLPLTIDPVLIFSTYSGSVANNFGYTATYDDKGYLYAGGSVFSQGYPTTNGAFDITFNSYTTTAGVANFSGYYWGVSDIGITKYNLNGTARIYSTYIGGTHCEVPHSLIVNNRDELFILGTTSSFDYPVSASAFDNSFGGGTGVNLARGIFVNYTEGSDIVISRLSKNGDAMLASTFVGGSQNDGLNLNIDLVANYADQMRGEIILDENQNVVIGSSSASTDFPITLNATQTTYGGGDQDGVVFKMNEDLSTMIWSTFFGGSNSDGVYSVIKANDNNIYVAGGTKSTNFSFPSDAYQTAYQGGITDGFYAKIKSDGNTVLKGSYFGSDQYDQIYFIREDKQDRIYVFGQSDKFGTYWIKNATYNSPNSGQFISKFEANQQSLDWSTTFGSGNNMINISPTAFMVDLCNKVYLSGWGSPSNGMDQIGGNIANGTSGMEVTADAYKPTTDNEDFYLMVLEDDASSLFYASFFGGDLSGEHVDGGTSRFDSKGVMYQSVCAGCGGNDDFPIFPSNVVGPTNEGIFIDLYGNQYPYGCNNGVFKFDFGIPNIIADFNNPPIICAPDTIHFKDNSKTQSSTTWSWDFGDGSFSTDTNPSHEYALAGVYKVKLIIQDPISCNLIDSIEKTITVMGGNRFQSGVDSVCLGTGLQIGLVPYADTAISYIWSPTIDLSNTSISNPIATVNQPRDYQLIIQNSTCADTLYHSVFPLSSTHVLRDTMSCLNTLTSVPFLGNGDYMKYHWSSSSNFTDTINTTMTDSIFTLPFLSKDTVFYVRATSIEGCVVQDSLKVQVIGISSSLSDVISCRNDTIELMDTANGEFVLSYNWEPSDSIISELNGVIQVVPFDSMEFVLVKEYGVGCKDTVSVQIHVPFFKPLALRDTLLCNWFGPYWVRGDTNEVYTERLWSVAADFSDTLSTNNSFAAALQDGNNTFYVKYTDQYGCLYTDSITINNVVFKIETNADSIICGTSISDAEVINYQLNHFDSLIWGPSSEVIGDSSQLKVSFLADKKINEIWVVGMDTNGCYDTDTVIVLNLSVAGADLPDTSICLGDTVQIGVDFDETVGVTFSWFLASMLSDVNVPNPFSWATDTITYGLVISNGACADTFYQTINVAEIVVKAFGDTAFCNSGNSVLITDSSTADLTHVWSLDAYFSDTLLSGIDSNSLWVNPPVGETVYYVKTTNSIGCTAKDSVVINRYVYDISLPESFDLCLKDTLNLEPIGYQLYDSVVFVWGHPELLSAVNDTVASVSPSPGFSILTLHSESANGCVDNDTVEIQKAKFDTTYTFVTTSFDTLIKNETAVLTALPLGMEYVWQPAGDVISTDANTATVKISKNTVFTVEIKDSSVAACSQLDSIHVTFVDAICDAPYIYVPNAFTPNGDGENDLMLVRGRNITEMYFAIYNRWGQLVFETKDQSVGWDGYYQGMKVDPAVYDYYLKYSCDGVDEKFMKGNITLIR